MKFDVKVTYRGAEGYQKVRTISLDADNISGAHTKAHSMIRDLKEVIYTSSRTITS